MLHVCRTWLCVNFFETIIHTQNSFFGHSQIHILNFHSQLSLNWKWWGRSVVYRGWCLSWEAQSQNFQWTYLLPLLKGSLSNIIKLKKALALSGPKNISHRKSVCVCVCVCVSVWYLWMYVWYLWMCVCMRVYCTCLNAFAWVRVIETYVLTDVIHTP